MKVNYVIAIDGPAGSGKSTVAKEVARRLGFLYLDSGAFYRAITLLFLKEKLDFSHENKQIPILLEKAEVRLENSQSGVGVFLNDFDVTTEIRSHEVTEFVSHVAEREDVRRRVTSLLRRIARRSSVVMDGRDIGTAVFPKASLKIYMDASIEERANRRYKEDQLAGRHTNYEAIKIDIERRDKHDSQRAIAPLTKAPDAIVLDTTALTINQSVEFIVERVKAKESQA